MSEAQLASVRGVETPDDSSPLIVLVTSGARARGRRGVSGSTGVSVMPVTNVIVLEPQTERPSQSMRWLAMRRPLLSTRERSGVVVSWLGPLYMLYSPVDHSQGPRECGFILCPFMVSEPWSDDGAWRKVFVPSETLLEGVRFR